MDHPRFYEFLPQPRHAEGPAFTYNAEKTSQVIFAAKRGQP